MLFQQASKERASALRKPASFNHRVMSNSGIATACNETGCQDPLEPLIASKHVLNLTGAAISSLDASVPDGGELAVLAKREFVPSISLPRQCTHVRHFAMGAYDLNLSSASSLTDTCTIFQIWGAHLSSWYTFRQMWNPISGSQHFLRQYLAEDAYISRNSKLPKLSNA